MRNLDTKIRCYRKKDHLLNCKILELEIKLAECGIDYSAECEKKNCELDYCCDVFQTHMHKEFQELKHCVCCKADYARCLQALHDAKNPPEPVAKDAVVHVGKVPLPPVEEVKEDAPKGEEKKVEITPEDDKDVKDETEKDNKTVVVDADALLRGEVKTKAVKNQS